MKRLASLFAVAAIAAATVTVIAQDSPKPDRPEGGERRGPRPEGTQDGERRPGGPNGPRGQGERPMIPPLFAALDANHDGVIDETEIAQASEHLKKLDKNGDGKISMDEIGARPGRGPGGPGGQEGGSGEGRRGPRPEGGKEGGPRGPRPDGEGRPNGPRPSGNSN